ncbi:MAG TPA: hypothetical protein VEY09_14490 [Pyrinomonadaceae bacterium]|nr:hypothetical protein [Pyrinomonadaceae bacterium]
MLDEAIAEYHGLLNSSAGVGEELFARLRAAMAARRLLYGEREIGVALRPHLLTRADYDRLAHASEAVAGAFEKLGAAMLEDPALMARVGMTEREREVALVHPGYECLSVNARLDAFMTRGGVKFVEYNAENPSSLPDQAGLNEVLFEVPALQEFAERYRLWQPDPTAALLASIVETYREWGGRGLPNVAIVDWAGLPTEHEFHLLRTYFASRGVPTIVCAPGELEYDGRHLRRGAFRIDVVYKRVIIHELLSLCDDAHPLLRAYRDRAACFANSLRCKMVHKKAAFELLTDGEIARRFTPAEAEVIAAAVPWTRRFFERRTTRDGREVDLVEHVRARREEFVLKPNDDYGGTAVTLGPRAAASEWDAAIEAGLAGDYVVQELVELRAEEFPVFGESDWGIQPMYVDTNPFLFRNRVEGALVRLSLSPVVNVTSGGGETGLFVVEERLD